MNTNYPIVDSNIFIDWFCGDKDILFFEQIFNEPVYLNLGIFAEVTNFLKNKINLKSSITFAENILENPDSFIFLPELEELRSDALSIMDTYQSTKFSFVDSYILAQAEYYQLRVITQDRVMTVYPYVTVESGY